VGLVDAGLTNGPANPILALEASLTAEELVRPWRRATVIATLIAAVELLLLIAGAAVLVARPLAQAVERRAQQHAHKAAPAKPGPVHPAIVHRHAPAAKPSHSRAQTKVLVLNGNGRTGVAHEEASKLESLGYRIAGAADAHRHDYATSLVMYRRGYRPEGLRLARDLHVAVVGPLDGVSLSALQGGQLAVILGAR
jgi:LytR cell envelope-related transcriptional attenuator